MQRSTIETCLADPSAWFIVIPGDFDLGRYMPDDVKAAFKLLVDFASQLDSVLFEPPTQLGRATTLHVIAMSADHGKMYLPSYQPLTPTLMRKRMERMVREDPETLVQHMEDLDTYSDVSLEFKAASPEKQARMSRAYAEKYLGPMLKVPSEEDRCATQRTAAVIMSEFEAAICKPVIH